MIILYSNHCPKCDIVKEKLDEKKIDYKIVDDIEWLTENGFNDMPVLEVNGVRFTRMIEMNEFIRSL